MAILKGEKNAEVLEAMRRAGGHVYVELGTAEEIRKEFSTRDGGLWNASVGVSSYLLSVWNAFALQTLAETLLDADYKNDPSTAGYVPEITFEQAWTWFSAVEPWLSQAQQAQANRLMTSEAS